MSNGSFICNRAKAGLIKTILIRLKTIYLIFEKSDVSCFTTVNVCIATELL